MSSCWRSRCACSGGRALIWLKRRWNSFWVIWDAMHHQLLILTYRVPRPGALAKPGGEFGVPLRLDRADPVSARRRRPGPDGHHPAGRRQPGRRGGLGRGWDRSRRRGPRGRCFGRIHGDGRRAAVDQRLAPIASRRGVRGRVGVSARDRRATGRWGCRARDWRRRTGFRSDCKATVTHRPPRASCRVMRAPESGVDGAGELWRMRDPIGVERHVTSCRKRIEEAEARRPEHVDPALRPGPSAGAGPCRPSASADAERMAAAGRGRRGDHDGLGRRVGAGADAVGRGAGEGRGRRTGAARR